MMTGPEATYERFREALLTVAGSMLAAAGYAPEDNPLHLSGGLFRFRRQHNPSLLLSVDYQILAHADYPARFQVNLSRTPVSGQTPLLPVAATSLAALLWHDFGVRVLPGPAHWWAFHDSRSLGEGLVESGRLLAGYGLPWLDGSLVPGDGA
ncbi:MAG: hypothetical protein JW910_10715 [Anaerolineae bacterium]|nr:hypothetical protein [Anaerolineae bacterium]